MDWKHLLKTQLLILGVELGAGVDSGMKADTTVHVIKGLNPSSEGTKETLNKILKQQEQKRKKKRAEQKRQERQNKQECQEKWEQQKCHFKARRTGGRKVAPTSGNPGECRGLRSRGSRETEYF